MPLTEKGQEIMTAMEKTYKSKKKAKEVFYASVNAGKITGVDEMQQALGSSLSQTTFVEKKKKREKGKTYMEGSKDRKVMQRDPFGREKSSFSSEGEPKDIEWELAGPLSDELSTDAWSEESRRAAAEARKRKQKAHREEFERKTAQRYPLNPSHEYNKEAVNQAIESSNRSGKRIGGKEAKLIHSLLKGRHDSVDMQIVDACSVSDEVQITDAIVFDEVTIDDAADVRFTDDGYLVACPRVARTGIQLYKGTECGKPDRDVVRVYRPHDSVFATDAIHSFAHRPVTLDHPNEPVTAANWKKYAVGQTGDEVLRDGDTIRVPMVLMDKAAIEDYKAGKNQLSMGYTCDLEWKAGLTPDGQPYDAIQTGIKANHLAVVSAARGGSTLKIGDAKPKQEGGTFVTEPIELSTDAWSEESRRAALEARKRRGKSEQLYESRRSGSHKDHPDYSTPWATAPASVRAEHMKMANKEK